MKPIKRSFVLLILMVCITGAYGAGPAGMPVLTINENTQSIILSRDNKVVVKIDSICFNFHAPDKMEVVRQDSHSAIVRLSYQHVSEKDSSNVYKDRDVEVSFQMKDHAWHIEAEAPWADNFSVFLADLDGHYYGVQERNYPDNQLNPDLRGENVYVAVDGEKYRYYENFATAWSAFYYNSHGYACFFDTFSEGEYKFAHKGYTELTHFTSKLDWYVFFGDNGNQIFKGYYTIIGKPKYTPLWACGPVVWRDDAKGGKNEVLEDVRLYTDLHIPLTCFLLDRPYSDGSDHWSKMNFNNKFSNPGEWIKQLKDDYDLEFITWVGPMTFSDHDFPGLLPGHMGYMDLTDPDAVKEFGKRLKEGQYDYGVKGHKMDRAEEYLPHYEPWYDQSPYWDHKNKYIWLYAKVIDAYLTESWGKDQFNFARAGFHRCQPYLSALWGGDSRSSWDGLAGNLANAIRTSFMGFPNWGSDVGGYLGQTGQIPDDLYIRWLQWGVWTGLYEIKYDGAGGHGEDRAPWHCSETVQASFRQACDQRMELIPYIYSHLNTAAENGTLMKPLAMMYPEDSRTYPIWDEYLFGNDFLVAPLTSPVNERSIYFPEGRWINFYKQEEKIAGGQTLRVASGTDHIPVYVREGSIFVTGSIQLGNKKNWEKGDNAFIINAYPSSTASGSAFDLVDMYDHDKVKHIGMNTSSSETVIRSEPLSCDSRIRVKLPSKPDRLFLNGKKLPVRYSQGALKDIPVEKGKSIDLVIKY